MSLIDSHCHLYFEPFISDIESTLNECKKNKIDLLLSIGIDLKTSRQNIELANKYSDIFCSIGVHPNEVSRINSDVIIDLKNLYKTSNKILAIGEIGLDYYRNQNKTEQLDFFDKQIDLAKELNLPVIIHTRDADNDMITIIKKHINKSNQKFLIHCFSGSLEFAKQLLNLDCYISLSGIVTFKNATHTHEVARYVPLNRLLIETDSPYLSPHPFRGQVNSPAKVIYVAKKIAELKEIKLIDIEKHTSNNFYSFFNLKK